MNDKDKLLESCRARKEDETGAMFIQLIEKYMRHYIEQLVDSEADTLVLRQGMAQAMRNLYEDLSYERRSK